MQIEIEVSVSNSNYGPTLGKAKLNLDSDVLDKPRLAQLAGDLVVSAITRAETKLTEPQVEAKPE